MEHTLEETTELYMDAVEELDSVLNDLTRDFCANDCTKGEYGCCKDKTMYHDGASGDELITFMQREEAESRGWEEHEKPCCHYMIPEKGCALRLYKPPICIGHLCGDIEDSLRKAFSDKETVRNFIVTMDDIAFNFYECSPENIRLEIARDMAFAAELGRRLISQVPSGYTPAEYIREMSS